VALRLADARSDLCLRETGLVEAEVGAPNLPNRNVLAHDVLDDVLVGAIARDEEAAHFGGLEPTVFREQSECPVSALASDDLVVARLGEGTHHEVLQQPVLRDRASELLDAVKGSPNLVYVGPDAHEWND
jgi:hypothetical protein